MYSKYLFFFLLVIIVVGCKKKDRYAQVMVAGHAGAGLHTSTSPYHDNSLESIEYAMSFDALQGIEIDLQISKDSTIWLYHDDNLSEETNLTGCIRDLTDIEIDAGNYSSLEKEKLVCLNDVPNYFAGKKLYFDFREVNKCSGAPVDSLTIVKAFSEINNVFQNVHISVLLNSDRWITLFHTYGWDVYLDANSKEHYFSLPNWQQTEGVNVRSSTISKSEVSEIQALGKKVVIFDVRSPKGIKTALKKQADVLLTDDIKATFIEKYR